MMRRLPIEKGAVTGRQVRVAEGGHQTCRRQLRYPGHSGTSLVKVVPSLGLHSLPSDVGLKIIDSEK